MKHLKHVCAIGGFAFLVGCLATLLLDPNNPWVIPSGLLAVTLLYATINTRKKETREAIVTQSFVEPESEDEDFGFAEPAPAWLALPAVLFITAAVLWALTG